MSLIEIAVPEAELRLYEKWKKTNERGRRTLKQVEPVNSLAVVVTCGDPRFFLPQVDRLSKLYKSVWFITHAGGASKLAPHCKSFEACHLESTLRTIEEVLTLKKVRKGEKVDLFLKNHIDCLWRQQEQMSILENCYALQAGAGQFSTSLASWVDVRYGHHLLWPWTQKQKTYELLIEEALWGLEQLRPSEFATEEEARAILGRIN